MEFIKYIAFGFLSVIVGYAVILIMYRTIAEMFRLKRFPTQVGFECEICGHKERINNSKLAIDYLKERTFKCAKCDAEYKIKYKRHLDAATGAAPEGFELIEKPKKQPTQLKIPFGKKVIK